MGIRFRFKTAGTQRVYTVLKIVLKLVFIEMTKFKTQVIRPIGLNIFINGIEQMMTIIQRISFLNFKNQSTVLISGLSLFHASIKEGIKEFLKISVLQLKLSTLSNC